MSGSDTSDVTNFKIRDGLAVLVCVVLIALLILLASRSGMFSLTPASGFVKIEAAAFSKEM